MLARLSAVALVAACGSAVVRPSFRPFPNAPVDTIPGDADRVVTAAAARIAQRGLEIRLNAPREGYLETRWFDLVARRSVAIGADPNRVIRLRLFADPVTPRATLLTIEALYRRTLDPSIPEREAELMVPPGTPGDSLARNVISEVKRQMSP